MHEENGTSGSIIPFCILRSRTLLLCTLQQRKQIRDARGAVECAVLRVSKLRLFSNDTAYFWAGVHLEKYTSCPVRESSPGLGNNSYPPRLYFFCGMYVLRMYMYVSLNLSLIDFLW